MINRKLAGTIISATFSKITSLYFSKDVWKQTKSRKLVIFHDTSSCALSWFRSNLVHRTGRKQLQLWRFEANCPLPFFLVHQHKVSQRTSRDSRLEKPQTTYVVTSWKCSAPYRAMLPGEDTRLLWKPSTTFEVWRGTRYNIHVP